MDDKTNEYISKFLIALEKEDDWKKDLKERHKRKDEYQRMLGRSVIDFLTEEQFAQTVKGLWASFFWTDKNQPVKRILKDTPFDEVKLALKDLFYGNGTIGERYDKFRAKVSGLGTSSLTEILCFTLPLECCIWNDKPRKVLPFLKMEQGLPPRVFRAGNIDGSDYEKCMKLLESVRSSLVEGGLKDADFIVTDLFMWFIFNKMQAVAEKTQPLPGTEPVPERFPVSQISTHTEAQGIILELGQILGYDTYVADPSKAYRGKRIEEVATCRDIPPEYQGIKNIEKVDVIWFGSASFCFFEVVDSIGTLNEALHRLFQALPLNAKFFVVAPEDHRSKFEKYMSESPYKVYKHRYYFRSYQELASFFELTKDFTEARRDFLRE